MKTKDEIRIGENFTRLLTGSSYSIVDSNLLGFHKGTKLKKLGLKGRVGHWRNRKSQHNGKQCSVNLLPYSSPTNSIQHHVPLHPETWKGTAELFFEGLRVPSSALLDKENHGFHNLMAQLPQGSSPSSGWVVATDATLYLGRSAFKASCSHFTHRLVFPLNVSDKRWLCYGGDLESRGDVRIDL